MELIVKAIENDDDDHDETMDNSPYGKYSYETYPNYGYNFIHSEGAPSIYHAPYGGGYRGRKGGRYGGRYGGGYAGNY